MANKRREKGAGSIRKIGAKYYGRLMIDGVTKNFVGDSAADVRRQMREYDPEREEKERNNPLVTDYMQTWLTTYKKPSLRPSSYDRIECTATYQILPYYKGVRLSDLTPETISQWMQRLQAEGLSYSSIKKAYVALNAALDQALLSGLLSRSPMAGLSIISPDHFTPSDIRYLSKSEIQLFHSYLTTQCSGMTTSPEKNQLNCSDITTKSTKKRERAGKKPSKCSYLTTKPQETEEKTVICSYFTNSSWYAPALILDLHTGLRGGELAALQVSDYDAEAHTLHVRQTARKYRTRDKAGALQQGITVQYGRPKTRAGTRIVPCDTIAQQAVQELIRRAKAARSPFLVVSKAGTPTTITLLEHAAERIFRRIGAEGATLHSLRHTFASQLFAAGVDVLTISRTLGHASTAITMQVYVHMTQESQAAAAAKIEAALSAI